MFRLVFFGIDGGSGTGGALRGIVVLGLVLSGVGGGETGGSLVLGSGGGGGTGGALVPELGGTGGGIGGALEGIGGGPPKLLIMQLSLNYL